MDPVVIALGLIGLGLLLLIIEAFMPGGYLVIPGTVFVIVGIIGSVFPDFLFTWKSPLVAAVVAIPVTAVTVWGYRRLGRPEPPSTTVADSLVGKQGTVVTAIVPGNMKGKVRIGSDIWSAEADEAIPEGTAVSVDAGSGVHVHVKKL
ncbi:MAG: NfeD family protein [Methanomethylophilus sp.]|nr:NfeD family protein [Methanomethylophilus sp.]MDD4669052.1 NfeD family protein [Methanomethylophilus sp.]